ncbi:unnamed protein product [Nippostrongylus brasiliensis]|uniref:JmjC domain-containing protein n=1 Tax=Nippostrongylus brasiliensis TaxID=27835 RepID=A0A0N4YI37_NIPBR|nr:unnamed protein product [Nippostrongylus brasiliensis]
MLLLLLICLPIHAEVALEGDGGWVTDKKDVVGQEGPCNIERHDARELTEKEFLHRYAYAEPVIIYNIDNEEFREKTAKQRMIDDWKDSPKPTTFGDYVETQLKAQNRDTLGNETMYLFGDIDQTLWAPLLQSYKLPKWSLPGHKPALSFGIAGAGTGVPFHFHGPGFAEVIYGSKRWFLYPYEDRPDFEPDRTTLDWYLHEYPALPREKRPLECLMKPGETFSHCNASDFERTTLICPWGNYYPRCGLWVTISGTGVPFHFHGPGFAEVIYGSKRWFLYPYEDRPDFEPDRTTLDWYLHEYPALPREKRPLECLMKPGEVIYFPDKWWHATLNTETSVFISTFLSP